MRTTVQAIVNKIKRRVDYNITDTGTDDIIVDCLNDAIKILRQKLIDRGINFEVGGSAILSTTASQAYIDLTNIPAVPTLVSAAATGSVDAGVHGYKVTYVTAEGESEGSTAASVTVVAGDKVTVTISVSPNSDVTSRKIYRTTAGGSSYLLLATVANNTATTYLDNIADSSLGTTTCPTISTIPSFSELVRVTERVNYKAIDIIPYAEFLKFYPDPTAFSSSVPDKCALWNQRLYMGPTPMDDDTEIYIEFMRQDADLALTSNLYYENAYDPVLLAYTRLEWFRFFNAADRATIKTAEESALMYMNDLVIGAAKNIGQNKQVASRREEYLFGPRLPASVGSIGP